MVTQHLEIGGLERMVLQLCQELSKNSRWELWVFAYDQEDNDESLDLKKSLEDSGVKVEMFVKPKGFSLRAVLRLVQLIVKNDIEVLHSHDMGSLIYSSAARVLSLFRVKLVHTQHSFVHIQRFKRYAFYERVFTLLVSELVVLSEQGRELYKNLGISSRRIHVIPNGIVVPDVSALQEKNQGREDIVNRYKMDALADSTWILYLARLHPVKGQMEAIESFEKLSKEYQDRAALIFVGPEAFAGERAKLTQRISHSKAKERIVYLGPSSHPEEWLRSCDIFLSCSEFEGMPLAPLEALALGKTSLVSDIAGHKFISAISMTYIAGNSADCADKLAELITAQADMSTDRENAKLRSQQFVRERYSLQTMAERYQYLYDRSVPFVRSEEAVQ